MDVLQNIMKELGTKVDQPNKTTKIMTREEERIRRLVKRWEVKQKGLEEELCFMDYWHRKNNLLIFGIDKYLYESYFKTRKTT
jgi:hypothetical protein